jgi:hypothetical protein
VVSYRPVDEGEAAGLLSVLSIDEELLENIEVTASTSAGVPCE